MSNESKDNHRNADYFSLEIDIFFQWKISRLDRALTLAEYRYWIMCSFVDKLTSRRSACMLTKGFDELVRSRRLQVKKAWNWTPYFFKTQKSPYFGKEAIKGWCQSVKAATFVSVNRIWCVVFSSNFSDASSLIWPSSNGTMCWKTRCFSTSIHYD